MVYEGSRLRDLLILGFLFSALFGFQLGTRALWSPDEGRYSEIPREMVVTGDYLTPRLNGVKYFEKPPLFYWLQALSIKVFGLSEWSLRLWTAMFAVIGCLAVYLAGRRLFDRRTGLMSSVALGTSVLYYGMGRIITLDMAVSVLIAGAMLAFLTATREPPGLPRRLLVCSVYVFSALATMTKGLIGVVIPALVIGSWIVLCGQWKALKTLLSLMGLLLFFLIAVPWHIGVSMANPEFPNFYFLHEHFQRYLEKNHGLLYRWWFFIPVLLLGFLPWTALLPQAVRHALAIRWKSQEQFRLNMFLILWANCVFLFFTVSSSKLVPYILPLFPPLAILVGNYLAGAEESHGFGRLPAGAWAGVGGSLLILGIGLMVVPRFLPQNIDAVGIDGYLYGSASIIAAGSVAVLFWVKSSKFRRAFLSLVAAWILCLSLLSSGSSLFDDRRSVKKLAVALALRLQPGDEVASYRAYYQDLPVYLKRRVLVVGRLGELSFGAKQEDVSAWIMDDAAFWRQWNGPKTIYLLTSRDRYDKLRGEIGREVYLIAQTDWHVVLANKSGDRS